MTKFGHLHGVAVPARDAGHGEVRAHPGGGICVGARSPAELRRLRWNGASASSQLGRPPSRRRDRPLPVAARLLRRRKPTPLSRGDVLAAEQGPCGLPRRPFASVQGAPRVRSELKTRQLSTIFRPEKIVCRVWPRPRDFLPMSDRRTKLSLRHFFCERRTQTHDSDQQGRELRPRRDAPSFACPPLSRDPAPK